MVARNEIVATVPSNGTTSPVVNGGGLRLSGIYVPANFQGTTLKLLAAPATQQFGQGYTLSNSSGDISFTVAAGKYYGFDLNAATDGIQSVQILTGSSQSSGAANFLMVWAPWSN